MENAQAYTAAEDGRSTRRGRFMGKLFGGKDRKSDERDDTASSASLDAFLHNSADNLNVTHPPPPLPVQSSQPKLAKLDTNVSRYPQALAANQQAQFNRPLAAGSGVQSRSPRRSPRANKKGLMVRFTDAYPDVIGEGGDECEVPVMELSKRKPAKQPPPSAAVQQKSRPSPTKSVGSLDNQLRSADDFQPKPLSRTQTGYTSIHDVGIGNDSQVMPKTMQNSRPLESPPSTIQPPTLGQQDLLVPGSASSAKFLGSTDRPEENRKSFIELQQAQMAQAEGRAFAKAVRTASAASEHQWEEKHLTLSRALNDSPESIPQLPSPEVQTKPPLDYSPVGSISTTSSTYPPSAESPSKRSRDLARRPSAGSQAESSAPRPPPSFATRALSVRVTDAAAANAALNAFVARTKHLFELFRLHAEAVSPILSCSQTQCARGGLWWFLKGRMGLEAAVRERPTSPQTQMQNELDRQQAYTNLAKGYWLCHEILPDIIEAQKVMADPESAEVAESLVTALAKLAISMKRNGFLPPEEAFLPQTIDKSIWVEYPPISQDLVALLTGNWSAGLTAMQHPMSYLELLDAFPLGDTTDTFSFGRVHADVFLMEQGRENQQLRFPCMLSMVRPMKQKGLIFVLASQDGSIQLPIQDVKNAGPVFEDIRWRSEVCALELRLPRGFKLGIQLSKADYRTLYNMFDYASKLHATLQPREDEQVVFRNTLRSFQYLDSDPNSRAFTKEPVPQCEVALFEKIYKESGPVGPRTWHKGFRIAVVTGPKTRTACGVSHSFLPPQPVQFGFFRAEGESPALSVKFDTGRQKGRMVLVFGDEKERGRFHSLLTGTAIDHGEKIFADVPIKAFSIAQSLREPTGMAPFSRMPWKVGRVVNDEYDPEGEQASTVLADKLRIVLEYQHGTITDRVNVAPGELRMRLEVSNAKVLRLLRQPQQDITMSVAEPQVPKDIPKSMDDALQLIKTNQTIRSVEFGSLLDLHKFQAAVTGFEVIFDSLAVTFAISRRRMVVPIHKKWEAGYSRIQVVKQDDKQLQLLAFFEDFSHGHCMNFILKGTDVYETFHRSGKSGVRFVDAKFPLPRLPADKDGDFDDMAFVCLDLPDLPGEHDDISIMFENEEDRDRLVQCLPAPVKGSSRASRYK